MLLHDFWGISFVENHLRQIAHFFSNSKTYYITMFLHDFWGVYFSDIHSLQIAHFAMILHDF